MLSPFTPDLVEIRRCLSRHAAVYKCVSLNAVSPSAHVHLYQVQSPYKLVQVETPRTFQQGDPWEGRV